LKQKQKAYEKEESTITAGGTKKVNKTFCALSLVLGVGEFCVFHAINGKCERFISEQSKDIRLFNNNNLKT
jgi:hypothetical protein